MFKRRIPQSYGAAIGRAIYPRGGWRRAGWYIAYRLRRLPDPAHKISRGIAAGVFTSFTPIFGFHFVIAAGIAWAMRGNVLAAILGTFFGNPVTFPMIATVAVETGTWMLGQPPVPPQDILLGFSLTSVELWANLTAMFTDATAEWARTSDFFARIFLPYLVGGLPTGIVAALACYWLSYPVILSYQRGRLAKMRDRFEQRRRAVEAARAARAAEAEAVRAEAARAEAAAAAAVEVASVGEGRDER